MRRPMFFFVTELNFLLLVFWCLLGRRVFVIDIVAVFPGGRAVLASAIRFLIRHGRLADAYVACEDARKIFNRPHYCDYTDIFLKLKGEVAGHFCFDTVTEALGPYALPYKHTAWQETYDLADHALTIDTILQGKTGRDVVFVGVNKNLARIVRAYSGNRTPTTMHDWTWLRWAFNFLQSVGVYVYILLWSLVRTRIKLPPAKRFFLGSTYANKDHRLITNLEDIADSRDDVCMVFYGRQQAADARRYLDFDGFNECLLGDARFTPTSFLRANWNAIRDIVRVYAKTGDCRYTHFRRFVKLVWHRTAYAALFQTYKFRYFWGRDEINADHMIRTQELRKIGGCSVGTHHGMPTTNIVSPHRYFQDFDVLFTFGTHLYETYYQNAFPKHMEIIPIGAFGMSRRQMASIPAVRSRDIVIFTNLSLEHESFIATMVALAEAFPDRKIFFKSKGGYEKPFQALLDQIASIPGNVEICDPDYRLTYDLMINCGYAVSSHSTAGAEAIYYGLKTFILDNQPPNFPLYFRDFPGLCFREPREVVERIRKIEAGETAYPWQAYAGLVDMSNRNPFDVIRERMGLPPKDDQAVVPGLVASRASGPSAERRGANLGVNG